MRQDGEKITGAIINVNGECPFPRNVQLGGVIMRSMLVCNHRADTIMMIVPISRIVRSMVSQRGRDALRRFRHSLNPPRPLFVRVRSKTL